MMMIFSFNGFNFICAQPISSNCAGFVEQPERDLLLSPHRVTSNGGLISVRPFAQICSCFRGEIQEGSSGFCSRQKWKVILWYYNSNSALLDKKYDQYQLVRDWMEKSGTNVARSDS
jgi:hypothetical protein